MIICLRDRAMRYGDDTYVASGATAQEAYENYVGNTIDGDFDDLVFIEAKPLRVTKKVILEVKP
jgi:hypothetical protein